MSFILFLLKGSRPLLCTRRYHLLGIFASETHLSKKRYSVTQEESLKIWFWRLRSGFELKTHHSSFPPCHKKREYTQGSLAKCDKILALLMANQVPNCPPSARLLIKYVRESSLELMPNENFLFSFQNKTCGRAGSAKQTPVTQGQPAERTPGLTHGYRRVRERNRRNGRSPSGHLSQGNREHRRKTHSPWFQESSSKRARAHARHEQRSAQCPHPPVKAQSCECQALTSQSQLSPLYMWRKAE